MTNFKDIYFKKIIPDMKKELQLKNNFQVPKITKVVVNIGVGQSLGKKDILKKYIKNLSDITGQKPIVNKAKKSIAGFKIREGDYVGLSVTLRGQRMYDFLEKLITIVLPRKRDFRGLSPKSFDAQGNYAIGINEHTLFPDIAIDNVEFIHGLQINITTNANNSAKAKSLLTHFGFPFQKEK